MRINFLTPGYIYVPSGGIRVVYEYANHLVASGHEVSVIQPRRLKYFTPGEETTYYRIRRRLMKARSAFVKPSLDWLNIDARVKTLYPASSDPSCIPDGDAVFATAWNTVRSVLECPPSKGEKFYLIQHYETWMGPRNLVEETWRAPVHKIVVSKWLRDVGKSLGCGDLTYIPNGIDHGQYRVLRPIETRAPQVAMLFSKAAFKGAADGIAALEIVLRKFPDLKVVMFGATNLRPSLPKWVEYHSNPQQAFIVDAIYNKSSIFLCPSWAEGFALPPAEAAACGCAIVATDNGGIRDYVDNGISGLLSPPKDPAALAENLCKVLSDDGLRVRIAEAGRSAVLGLRWERSGRILEKIIRWAAERHESVPIA